MNLLISLPTESMMLNCNATVTYNNGLPVVEIESGIDLSHTDEIGELVDDSNAKEMVAYAIVEDGVISDRWASGFGFVLLIDIMEDH